jgi:hypothetical protein
MAEKKSTPKAAAPQSASPTLKKSAENAAQLKRTRNLTAHLNVAQHEGELELERQRAVAATKTLTAMDPLAPDSVNEAQGYPVASIVDGDIGNSTQHDDRQRRKQRIRFAGTSVGTEAGTLDDEIQEVVAEQGGGNPLIPQNTPPEL